MTRQARLLVDSGLTEAGYRYVVLDERWCGSCDDLGAGIVDRSRFPSIERLPARLAGWGLSAGISIRVGPGACRTMAGLAAACRRAISEWGFSYLSIGGQPDERALEDVLQAVREARGDVVIEVPAGLAASPKIHSLADHGVLFDRLEPDYFDLTRNRCDTIVGTNETDADAALSITRERARLTGPGRYVSPGALPIGQGMSEWEEQAVFGLYCVLAAPMLVAADLATASRKTIATLGNRDALAIHQDPLGDRGSAAHYYDPWHCLYRKMLADGSRALLMLNRCHHGAVFSLRSDRDFDTPAGASFSLHDVWQHEAAGTWWKELSLWVETTDAGTSPCSRLFRASVEHGGARHV